MELEDMIKQYLEQALAKEQAPAPQADPTTVQKAQPEVVTKNELSEILNGFAAKISEEVQKALPAEREPGAGRRGVEKNQPGTEEKDDLGAVIQKAVTNPEKLDSEEKELLYRLQYEHLTAGLRY